MKIINRALFWDIDTAQLDENKNAAFIIKRVLQLGDEADWQWLKNLYDMQSIKRCAMDERLDKKSLNFWKLILTK